MFKLIQKDRRENWFYPFVMLNLITSIFGLAYDNNEEDRPEITVCRRERGKTPNRQENLQDSYAKNIVHDHGFIISVKSNLFLRRDRNNIWIIVLNIDNETSYIYLLTPKSHQNSKVPDDSSPTIDYEAIKKQYFKELIKNYDEKELELLDGIIFRKSIGQVLNDKELVLYEDLDRHLYEFIKRDIIIPMLKTESYLKFQSNYFRRLLLARNLIEDMSRKTYVVEHLAKITKIDGIYYVNVKNYNCRILLKLYKPRGLEDKILFPYLDYNALKKEMILCFTEQPLSTLRELTGAWEKIKDVLSEKNDDATIFKIGFNKIFSEFILCRVLLLINCTSMHYITWKKL